VVDLVYFDLKLANAAEHAKHTGRDNARILANLGRVAELARDRVRVRIPVVPGVTLTDENFAGLIAQIRACGLSGATLLPYNPLGLSMAKRLGCDHPKAMHLRSQAPVRPSTKDLCSRFLTAAEFAEASARFDRAVRRVFAGSSTNS
jgi:pyruvate-formate lyase-activating enzyme